jgi:hypothetical protein
MSSNDRPSYGTWKTYRGCPAAKPVGDGEGARLLGGRRGVAQPVGGRVRDGRLDGVGTPAPYDDRRAHLHRERTLRLEVGEHRLQHAFDQVRREPVDERSLRQVRQVLLQPGHRPVQHQPGPGQPAVRVEPAEALRPPVGLHIAPRGDLHRARGGQGRDERQMLVAGDGLDTQAHTGGSFE